MHLLVVGLALLLPIASVTAQVPDGWAVYSAYSSGRYAVADGGLFLLHPRRLTRAPGGTRIVGLSTELTGSANRVARGANAVAIEAGTGYLLVGETGPANTVIELHRLRLSGRTAVLLSKVVVGTVATNPAGSNGITGIAMLPNGDAVLSVAGLANQLPLRGAHLARYTRATGLITPINTNAPVGDCHCVALSGDGKKIYFQITKPRVSRSPLYEVPITGGRTRTMIVNPPIRSLAVDAQGLLLATSNTHLLEINPQSGARRGIGSTYNVDTAAAAVERATGNVIVVAADAQSINRVVWTHRRTGRHTPLVNQLPATSSGIAIRQSPRIYGRTTTGSVTYRWSDVSASTRLPIAGNAQFNIEIAASVSAPPVGLMVVSPAAGAGAVVIGVAVNIDLTTAFSLGQVSAGTPIPLPIPTGLGRVSVFLQTFFPDAGTAGGIAATEGLAIGVIE